MKRYRDSVCLYKENNINNITEIKSTKYNFASCHSWNPLNMIIKVSISSSFKHSEFWEITHSNRTREYKIKLMPRK